MRTRCIRAANTFTLNTPQHTDMPLPRRQQQPNAVAQKHFVLDGAAQDFYTEAGRVLCPGFKGFGRCLDALRDVLRGGFGAFDVGEQIKITIRSHHSLSSRILEVFVEARDELGHTLELA